jgi:WhiB family transcriptional regulator, redox-sensing transcriptional regulator
MIATEHAADWRAHGACLSADPDLFFPISSAGPSARQVARAKSVCASCPVRRECLDFALNTHQVHGVWGGTSAEERQFIRGHRAHTRAAPARTGHR